MSDPHDDQLHRAEEAIEEAKLAEDQIDDATLPEDLRQRDYFDHLEVEERSDAEAWEELQPDATEFEPEKPGEEN